MPPRLIAPSRLRENRICPEPVMSAYIVGTLRILQIDAYASYVAAISGLSARFGGERLVAAAVCEVIEGDSPVGEHVVITRFPDAAQARAFLTSPIYLAARRLRKDAVEIELRLIEV